MAEPKQRTKTGYEIPIPDREQVLSDFARIVKPVPAKPSKKHRKRKRA